MPSSDLELLTVGRISIDLYCDQLGADWHAARTFQKAVGGSPTNVAIAAARLGRCAAVTKVGDDPLGEVALAELREFGVDMRYAAVEPGTVNARFAVGSGEPRVAAVRLLERGVQLAIVKLGGDGALLATAGGQHLVAPPAIDVLCGLGAGDAFGGALCHGLLSGWPFERSVAFAGAAGGIVASRLLCSQAMPFEHEVLELLGQEVQNAGEVRVWNG
jgi:sugar/nucleoside kinase (ribokinase family)